MKQPARLGLIAATLLTALVAAGCLGRAPLAPPAAQTAGHAPAGWDDPEPGPEPEPEPEPAPEPIPDHLGTPTSSRGAAPSWWTGSHPYGYLPRPPLLRALLEAAEDTPRQVDHLRDGALVCRVDASRFRGDAAEAGGYAGTDLTLGASVGGARPPDRKLWVWGLGPEDAGVATVLIPLIDLKVGQHLHLKLMDRDVMINDDIEVIHTPYRGAVPFEVKGRWGSGRCRFVPRAPIDRALPPLLARADAAIEGLEGGDPPDLRGYGLRGYAAANQGPAYDAIEAPASLVGWDDPRVQRRLARLETLAAARSRALAAYIQEARDDAPALGESPRPIADGALTLALSEVVCGKASLKSYRRAWPGSFRSVPADQCALTFTLVNTSTLPLEVDGNTGALGPVEAVEWVGPQARLEKLRFFALRQGRRVERTRRPHVLAPGESVEVIAAAPAAFSPDAPALFRVRHASRAIAPGGAPVDLGGLRLTLGPLDCDPDAAESLEASLPTSVRYSVSRLACSAELRVEVEADADASVGRGGVRLGVIRGLTLRPADKPYPSWRGALLFVDEGGARGDLKDLAALAPGRHTLVVGFGGSRRELDPAALVGTLGLEPQVELLSWPGGAP